MEPIDYQIVRHLQASLGQMARSDGYHFDVEAVAVKLDPNQDVEAFIGPEGPRPFIVVELDTDNERWGYGQAGQLEQTLPAVIHWFGESDPTVDESWLQVFLQGCADIERALTVDLSRGGLASDTRIVGRSHFRKGAQVEAIVDVEMLVCRQYGAPDA